MFYIVAAQPFTEKVINFTSIYSELVIAMIYFFLPFQEALISQTSKDRFDDFMVFAIYSVFIVQAIAPFYILIRNIRYRVQMWRNLRKVIPEINTEIRTTDLQMNSLYVKDLD
jgi:hypothetical protein